MTRSKIEKSTDSLARKGLDFSTLPSFVAKLVAVADEEERLIDELCRAVLSGDLATAKALAEQLSRTQAPVLKARNL